MDKHALSRTSPKGPGEKFIGVCVKCGIGGLTIADTNQECVNPAGLNNDETFELIIKGPSGIY